MSATLAAGRPVGRLLAEMRRWTPCPLKKMAEPPFSAATQALWSERLFLPDCVEKLGIARVRGR
jgi:hypothetical protein